MGRLGNQGCGPGIARASPDLDRKLPERCHLPHGDGRLRRHGADRGLTGNLVLANDGTAPNGDACSPLVNGAAVGGKIALIDRGTCSFMGKAQVAQNAGAIAVIIVNNVADPTPPGLGGSDPSITIPVVSITQTDGTTLKAQLLSGTVNVTLNRDLTQFAGADAQGRVLMFAPNPLQQGSSVSHWDVSCTPNTLMEPAINSDLGAGNVDLTRYLFQDIGWFQGVTEATPSVPLVTRCTAISPTRSTPRRRSDSISAPRVRSP